MTDKQYDVSGCRALFAAIVEQGVEDILKGDPAAIAWLYSPDFAHYCSWLDIDAARARAAIEQRRKVTKVKYTEADLHRVMHLHDNGRPWHEAIKEVWGYYSETLRMIVNDYHAFLNRTMAG